MRDDSMNKLSRDQTEQIARLKTRPDEGIDLSDAPQRSDWDTAERGKFYRPLKKQITLRIDADVLAWFKEDGSKYQTRINSALREYIEEQQR